MPQNYFLTGMPKAGKTTVLWELVKELKDNGLKVGGFLSPDEKHHGTRTAFHVVDVQSRKKALLADVNGDGPKVSKYHVNIKSFEEVAIPAMRKCSQCDVMVIDEIGMMEMKSGKFLKELDNILDSDVPLIASLGQDYVKKFSPLGEVLNVTPSSREKIHKRLLEEASSTIRKRKEPAPAKKKKTGMKKEAPKKKARKKSSRAEHAEKKKPRKKAPRKKSSRAAKKKAPKAEKKPEPAREEPREEPPKAEPEHKEKPRKKGGLFDSIKDFIGV
jgi:nucleoside-triphosphatase